MNKKHIIVWGFVILFTVPFYAEEKQDLIQLKRWILSNDVDVKSIKKSTGENYNISAPASVAGVRGDLTDDPLYNIPYWKGKNDVFKEAKDPVVYLEDNLNNAETFWKKEDFKSAIPLYEKIANESDGKTKELAELRVIVAKTIVTSDILYGIREIKMFIDRYPNSDYIDYAKKMLNRFIENL